MNFSSAILYAFVVSTRMPYRNLVIIDEVPPPTLGHKYVWCLFSLYKLQSLPVGLVCFTTFTCRSAMWLR